MTHQPADAEGQGTESSPMRVGCVSDPRARVVRLVHISDTHSEQTEVVIPPGDILVHSGDFFQYSDSLNFDEDVDTIAKFFATQPHRHKIFVAGNHEMSFRGHSADEVRQRLQASCSDVIYLEDSGVTVEGLRVYGSPWTGQRCSPASAFTMPYSQLHTAWSAIPPDTDLLVTHSPPRSIMDGPLGCPDLTKIIFDRIRPMVHLFGHAHQGSQAQIIGRILFSNATLPQLFHAIVIDIYLSPTSQPASSPHTDHKLTSGDDDADPQPSRRQKHSVKRRRCTLN